VNGAVTHPQCSRLIASDQAVLTREKPRYCDCMFAWGAGLHIRGLSCNLGTALLRAPHRWLNWCYVFAQRTSCPKEA
jgi:hypothetical protein